LVIFYKFDEFVLFLPDYLFKFLTVITGSLGFATDGNTVHYPLSSFYSSLVVSFLAPRAFALPAWRSFHLALALICASSSL